MQEELSQQNQTEQHVAFDNGFPNETQHQAEFSNVGQDVGQDDAIRLKASVMDAALQGLPVRVQWSGEKLAEGAFSMRANVHEVILPNAKEVGVRAFWNCRFIESVNMPVVEKIGDLAFGSTASLKTIILGNTEKVVCLGEDAFLTSLHFIGEQNTYGNSNGEKDGFIYVPDEMLEDYKLSNDWAQMASQIKPLSALDE